MYLDSNQPYQKVSQDNSSISGGWIGMGVGASVGGLGVMGARRSFNNIDKKSERNLLSVEAMQQNAENNMAKTQINHQKRTENMGPRRWQKNKYNTTLDRDYIQKVDEQVSRRRQKTEEKYDKKMNAHIENLNKVSEKRERYNPETMRGKHVYRKMGGWKNAAIVGASAVIGGGVGALTDHLSD